jgi:hypothetical protein
VTAPNVWWPIAAHPQGAARAAVGGFAGTLPAWLAALTHPAIVFAGVPLGLWFLRRRRRAGDPAVLGLFALLMLLRCLLDPWNADYYHAPFLLSLLAWEALSRPGVPRVTLLAGAALALTFPAEVDAQREISAHALRYCVTYLAWALPLCAWLAASVLAPGRLARLARVLRGDTPAPALART